MIINVIILFVSYLMGAIPFGKIFSYCIARINIQEVGSGNIGATNVARSLGIKWGLITLACDVVKGAIPVFFTLYILKNEYLAALSGLLAIIGHCFPIYLKFKGGKGVATACGAFLIINPEAVAISIIIFIFVLFITRIVSLSSLIATINFPVISIFFGSPVILVYSSITAALLITYRHKENIYRLIKGEEKKLRLGSSRRIKD